MKLYTIGYEGVTPTQLIAALIRNSVRLVIDVRELPLSRKPGFSKTPLSKSLLSAGIEYLSVPALGCPREIRNEYKHTADWGIYKLGFLDYLGRSDEALTNIRALAQTRIVCLLCYEANPYRCHRSMVAQSLVDLEPITFQLAHLVATPEETRVGLPLAPAFEVDRLSQL